LFDDTVDNWSPETFAWLVNFLTWPIGLILSTVEESYSRFSGPQLSTMTHKTGTPWHNYYDDNVFWNSEPIPQDEIEKYYVELLNERQAIAAL
jgi:uncharacterized phage-associated protein